MTRTCPTCGAVDGVPWLKGHRPGCPQYVPPASCRVCPQCRAPMAVADITFGEAITVAFTCRTCGSGWDETTAPDPAAADQADDDDPQLSNALDSSGSVPTTGAGVIHLQPVTSPTRKSTFSASTPETNETTELQ